MEKKKARSKMTRRNFLLRGGLGLGALGVLGAAYMRCLEPEWLEVTHEKITRGPLMHWTGLKILHLSDFHASDVVPYELIENAVDLGLAENPDLICLTGDFITWKLSGVETYKRILNKLSTTAPTFACIGNHDGGNWARKSKGYSDFRKVKSLLEKSGVQFLFNQSKRVNINDRMLTVAGLGDLWAGDTEPQFALKMNREWNEPVIVLCHNPDAKELLEPYDWDLLLCGHTHGGQLRVPFLGMTPFAPVRDHAFVEGLREWKNRYIYITRGVGNLHGCRINCRPQVSILEV